MSKSGGVIAIIAGILGFFAAIVTLFFGGLGSALEADGAATVIGFGWGGVLFSFLTIVFAAVAFAKPKIAGICLIISAILGAILGGTLVAVCMALALIGGILSLVGAGKNLPPPTPMTETPLSQHNALDIHEAGVSSQGTMSISNDVQRVVPAQKKKRIWIWGVVGAALISIIVILMVGYDTTPKISDPIAALYDEHPINIQPYGELASIFNIGSDYTDLQRENKLKEIKGKVVEWSLPIYEVSSSGDGYRIQTASGFNKLGSSPVGTFIYITPRDAAERQIIERMKTGDVVKFRGRIGGVSLRSLNIKPAVLYRPTADIQTTTRPQVEPKQSQAPSLPALPATVPTPRYKEVEVVGNVDHPGQTHGFINSTDGGEGLGFEMVPEIGYRILAICPVGAQCKVKALVDIDEVGLIDKILSIELLSPPPQPIVRAQPSPSAQPHVAPSQVAEAKPSSASGMSEVTLMTGKEKVVLSGNLWVLTGEAGEILMFDAKTEMGKKLFTVCGSGQHACTIKALVDANGILQELLSLESNSPMLASLEGRVHATQQNSQPPSVPQVKPSFDCAKATTPVEIAICSDSGLAQLDIAMARLYSLARDKTDRKQLVAEQRKWIEELNQQCGSSPSINQCTRESYFARIQQLGRYIAPGGALK